MVLPPAVPHARPGDERSSSGRPSAAVATLSGIGHFPFAPSSAPASTVLRAAGG